MGGNLNKKCKSSVKNSIPLPFCSRLWHIYVNNANCGQSLIRVKFIVMKRGEKIIFAGIIAVFLALHFFGLNQPYHQDEYKWVLYANPEITAPGAVPHPPLTEFIYTRLGPIVGDNNFRLIPLFFGSINLILVFYLLRIVADTKSALWGIFLFTTSFFSLLASNMVDVDGAVMPMFLLLMLIGYFKLRLNNFNFQTSGKKWFLLFIFGAIGGILIKMSGVLSLLAIIIDFALIKGLFDNKKKFLKFLGLIFGLGVAIIVLLVVAKLAFPFFPIEKSIVYWQHFWNSSSFWDRGWFQTFIQFAKGLMYLSPMLVLPILFINKIIFQKIRPLFIFIIVALVFYLVLFDFSIGALDRYFQFLIIPLCIISGIVLAKLLPTFRNGIDVLDGIIILVISTILFSLQFFNHFVPPLYPKSEWLSRLVSFNWNFLFPFTGGSGPTGFYVSFLFIALVWLVSIIIVLRNIHNPILHQKIIFGVLFLGLVYNSVFIEEYLFGQINGSAKKLVNESVAFIKENPDIERVVVYNDNGGFEVMKTGKYARRLYATPQFEGTYRDFFKTFSGHVMYVNIPRLAKGTFYTEYLNSCREIFKTTDRYLEGRVLDCRGGK